MALILEDGTGLEDATAYCDEALADTLLPTFGPISGDWTAATSPQKEDALNASTRYMDLTYSWLGEQLNRGIQALEFPRIGIRCDGVDQIALPVPIQEACALLAVLHLEEIAATRLQGLFGLGIIGTGAASPVKNKRIKIGSGIEWERQSGGSQEHKNAAEKAIPSLTALLLCYLRDRGSVASGRMGLM